MAFHFKKKNLFLRDQSVDLGGKSQVEDFGFLSVWILNQRQKCTIMAHFSMYLTNPKGSTVSF